MIKINFWIYFKLKNTKKNNNTNEQKMNSIKNQTNKFIGYNANSDNDLYSDEKITMKTNENNNLMNSTNSNNGNNNIIFQNSFKKNTIINNIDNYSFNTNLNTKSHTINSINSVKGKENKKIASEESENSNNNNNNKLIMIEKINTEKKARAVSTNPYIIKTTI